MPEVLVEETRHARGRVKLGKTDETMALAFIDPDLMRRALLKQQLLQHTGM